MLMNRPQPSSCRASQDASTRIITTSITSPPEPTLEPTQAPPVAPPPIVLPQHHMLSRLKGEVTQTIL